MKTRHFVAACLLVASSAEALAETPFLCGRFSPNQTLSTSADLGITATSMIASPGQPLLPDQLAQPGWFLVDMYGAGPVMGCQPSTSTIQGWSQKNGYFPDGTLKDVIATRFQSPPAKLSFAYEPTLPYRLQTAENFCMSIGGQKVRYAFKYKAGRLVSMQLALDSACPSPAPVTVTYDYADPSVPGLPTLMTVTQQGNAPQVVRYAYAVAGGMIQSAKVTPAGGAAFTLQLSYSGNLISGINWGGTNMTVGYRNGDQWASMLDSGHGSGLTISYDGNRVSKTLQDTGCPGQCPPSTFGY